MENVKIVARVYYDTGPYSDVWPYIEVGFSDPRFKNPVSLRFFDQLPEGRGPAHYSQIPLEVRDQTLKMASESPPLITGEEGELGKKYLFILALVADSFPEEFTHQKLVDLLRKAGVVYSLSQLRRITIELARAGFLFRRGKRGYSLKLKLTRKGLNFLAVKRG